MHPESVDSPPAVEQRPEVLGVEEDDVVHSTSLVERKAFVVSVCTCGWHSYARRSRPLARREGRDHELLHAPAQG